MNREFKLPGGNSGGLKCQACGTELEHVYRTTRSGGFVMRERVCPQCSAVNTTAERVLNARPGKTRFSDPCME